MTRVFKLMYGATTLSLDAAENAGWRFASRGWLPKVSEATPGRLPPPVEETIDFIVDCSSDDLLATSLQAMDDMRMLAASYISDRTQATPVWFHCKMDGETGERRALVRKITLSPLSPVLDETGEPVAHQMKMRVTIEREPYWERTSATTAGVGSNISVLGGIFDYTAGGGADVVGDIPARVNKIDVESSTTIALTQAWLGFRSANKYGTLANFVSKWEAEDGTNYTDAADAADATASGGNRVTINYATVTAWDKRFYLKLSDVTANYADNYGIFKVLVRAKVTAGTSEIRAKYTYVSTSYLSDVIPGPITEVADTNWHMYDLGLMTVPLRDLRYITTSDLAAALDQESTLELWSRQTAAGDLYIDCFVLIPVDEHFVYVENTEIYTDGSHNEWHLHLFQNSQREYHGMSTRATPAPYTLDKFTRAAIPSQHGIGIPIGDGRLYICMAVETGGNSFDDVCGLELSAIPAWHTLRGSE